MGKTDFVDIIELKDELNNFIRVQLYSLDTKNRESITTQNFVATAGQTNFPLTNGSRLRFVSSVTQNGTPLNFGDDYDFTFPGLNRSNSGIIILNTGATLNDDISVVYGFANTFVKDNIIKSKDAMVYTDFPRNDLGISKYPRVGIQVQIPRDMGGLSGGTQNVLKSNIRISVLMLSLDNFELDTFEKTITKAIIQNAKNFFNFRYIYPENSNNINLSPDDTNNVLARNIDFIIPNRFEKITYT